MKLLFLFVLTCSIFLQSIVFIGGIVSAESAASFFGKEGPYEYYEQNISEYDWTCEEKNGKCLAIRSVYPNGKLAVYTNTIDGWALFKDPIGSTYIFIEESKPGKGYVGSRDSKDQFDIPGGVSVARSWLGLAAPTTPGEPPGMPEQQAAWIDAFLIKMENASYFDRDPWDPTRSYKTYSGDCTGDNVLLIDRFEANGENEAYHFGKTTFYKKSESSPDCGIVQGKDYVEVAVKDTDNYLIGAYRQDADTLYMPGEEGGDIIYDIYKRIAPDDVNIGDNPQRNRYFLVKDESGERDFSSYIETVDSDAEGRVRGSEQDSGDTVFKIIDGALPEAYGEISASNVPGGESTGEAPDITCEISLFNPLTWIACPLLEAAQLAVQQFDNAITQRLTINTNDYFNLDNSNGNAAGFYQAWSTFRYLALILLVIIGLIMVIAQATSSPVVDAYTIKKVIPKIFIAVIGISLSWSIMKFAVDLSNVLGLGLRSIIYAPFAGLNDPRLGSGGASLLGIGATVGLVSLGILGALSFAVTALLAVLIGFMVIVFREMLIVLLVVTAPVAIIAWILPNTQKAWKIWSDFFVKALLAFPIITMMIATGHVFSQIAAENAEELTGGEGLLWTLAAFIAYFGPYFMIPTAFRLAGGALATISGIANDKSRGGFDRLRNFRKQTQAKNWSDLKAGSRYSERNPLSRRVNRIGQGINAGWTGAYGLGERGRQAVDLNSQVAADENLKNNPKLQKLAFHDDGNAVMALSGGSRRGAEQAANELMNGWMRDDPNLTLAQAEARRDRALSAAAAVGFNRQNAQGALTTLAQNKSRSIGAGDRQIVQNGINRLAGGNDQMASNLRDSFAFHSSGAGRGDLGATSWQGPHASLDGFERTGLYQAANGHQHGVTAATDDAVHVANTGGADGMIRAAQHYNELEAMLPSSTGPVRDAVIQGMQRIENETNVTDWLNQDTGAQYAPGHPNAGTPVTVEETQIYDSDRGDPTHHRYDPAYAGGWSAAERQAGRRRVQRNQRNSDVVTAREYQRPDPANI